MKRYGYIYQDVTNIDNIKEAIRRASHDKTKRKSVQKILENIDYYALEIQQMLLNKTYTPSPYVEMKIFDGASHKERLISKPEFYPDQCIHWSLMLQVQNLFIKKFYTYTCSSIPSRGGYYAKKYIVHALKDYKRTKYTYQLDIRKFYPSIDNEILKKKLRRMFKDEDLLWLFDTIIDSAKGLPIGNYTSQWLANFYLNDLDHYIKEELRIPYYVRYADDMLLFSPNKRDLHNKRKLIEEYIAKENLSIKDNWKVFRTDSRPINFIGFYFYRDHVTLRDNIYLRIKKRAKKISKKGYLTLKDARGMTSYWGYIKNTDSYGFYVNSVKPYCDINNCKGVISNEKKKFK